MGVANFDALRSRVNDARATAFLAFDLLMLNGGDLRKKVVCGTEVVASEVSAPGEWRHSVRRAPRGRRRQIIRPDLQARP